MDAFHINITVILMSLLFSAIFSGSEIAFVSSNKLHFALRSKNGILSGRIASFFYKSPSKFMSMILVGNNLALVIYGIAMANILEPMIAEIIPEMVYKQTAILVIQTIFSTIIVLATAEFLPKSIFLLNPNRMFEFFALPLICIYYLLYPFVLLVAGLSRFFIVNVLGLEYRENKPVFRLADLDNLIKNTSEDKRLEDEGHITTKIFENALHFKKVKVRECMIPRTEVIAVAIDTSIDELKDAFIKSGYSKVLIYKETIDNIVGYCHSSSLFKKPENIKDIMLEIGMVPETMLANELLIQFIEERKNLAVVVDEFGGTSGIVTMEDIIEEIFGEIHDEHDAERLVEKQIDENTYLLSGRLEVDYLNDKYGWNIPNGDYDTIGGFILSVMEDIPRTNDLITSPPFSFTIVSMAGKRIDKIRMTYFPDPGQHQ